MELRIENVTKTYKGGERPALDNASLLIKSGEVAGIEGPSGSGKSTLLSLAAGLLRTDSGEIILDGENLNQMGDGELSKLRRTAVGYIPQEGSLLPQLTVEANVRLTDYFSAYSGEDEEVLKARAEGIMAGLGIEKIKKRRPSRLSGGERRRTSIARVLYQEASLILADEPTNDLDRASRDQVMDLFLKAADRGAGVIIVSHDGSVIERCTRRFSLSDGIISEI